MRSYKAKPCHAVGSRCISSNWLSPAKPAADDASSLAYALATIAKLSKCTPSGISVDDSACEQVLPIETHCCLSQSFLYDRFEFIRAEVTVALELRFVEELIRRCFMRKGGVSQGILLDIRRLVAG